MGTTSRSTDAAVANTEQIVSKFVVRDDKGLHMRPLSNIVEICQSPEFASLTLEAFCESSDKKVANPCSILDLMLFAAANGDVVEFRCLGCETAIGSLFEKLNALSFFESC